MRHRKHSLQGQSKPSSLQQQQRLLSSIAEFHSHLQQTSHIQAIFAELLNAIRENTDSPFGAAGEVVTDGEHPPRFKPWVSVYPQDADPTQFGAMMEQVMEAGRIHVVPNAQNPSRGRIIKRIFPDTFLGLPIHCGTAASL